MAGPCGRLRDTRLRDTRPSHSTTPPPAPAPPAQPLRPAPSASPPGGSVPATAGEAGSPWLPTARFLPARRRRLSAPPRPRGAEGRHRPPGVCPCRPPRLLSSGPSPLPPPAQGFSPSPRFSRRFLAPPRTPRPGSPRSEPARLPSLHPPPAAFPRLPLPPFRGEGGGPAAPPPAVT